MIIHPVFLALLFGFFIISIILYKLKPKYIYYSFLYYKKRFNQDKGSLSRLTQYSLYLFLVTFLYLTIDYIPFSEYLNKAILILPDSISDYLTTLKEHKTGIIASLAVVEIIVTILLFILFIKTPPSSQNKIANQLKITKITSHNKTNILAFFGSIKDVKGIQVIVTSENSDLDLASPSSTSISGRVRYMASTKDATGNIIKDPLYENIKAFKDDNNKHNNFDLGTCFISHTSELQKYGIESIIHAVSIKKNNDNTIYCNKSSIKDILSYSIKYCVENSFDSIFIPIFGIGSAQKNHVKYINEQLESLKIVLDNELTLSIVHLNIYLGVYRELDDLYLKKSTIETFR